MDHISKLILFLFISLFSASASAYYTELAAPPEWSGKGGGYDFSRFRLPPAGTASPSLPPAGAVTTTSAGQVINTRSTIAIGGRAIGIPASFPVSITPAAARTAASIAWRVTRASVIGALAAIMLEKGLKWIYDEVQQAWIEPTEINNGKEYRLYSSNDPTTDVYLNDFETVCKKFLHAAFGMTGQVYEYRGVDYDLARCYYKQPQYNFVASQLASTRASTCPANYVKAGDGQCVPAQTRKVTEEEFIDVLQTQQIPAEILPDLFPDGVPVADPVVNPVRDPEGNPTAQPQPVFVPTGEPVPRVSVPEGDPNTHTQPGIVITPSPTITQPWRVDVRPVDLPSTSAGHAEPTVFPQPGTPTGTAVDTSQATKPAEPSLLCQAFPDISACARLGDFSADQSINQPTVDVSINEVGGIGPETGTCPAARSVNIRGVDYSMSYEPLCGLATGIRPVVIAVAWVSALIFFAAIARREG